MSVRHSHRVSVAREGKPPNVVAFIAAALPLASFPLAVVAFAFFLSDELRLQRTILVVWGEHSVAFTVLAGAALFAALGSALLVFSGAQRQGPALMAVAPLAGLVTVVAACLATWTVSQELVRGCSITPLDVPHVAVLVFVDGQLISAAGLIFASALLTTSALGLLVAALASQGSRVLWAVAALFGAGSFVCLVGVTRLWRLLVAVRTATRAGATDLIDGLVRETGALADHRPLLLLAGAVIAFTIVSGALALRRTPRSAALLVLFGGSTALPIASVVFATTNSTRAIRRAIPQAAVGELVTLDGQASAAPGLLLRRTASDTRSLALLTAWVKESGEIDRDLSVAANAEFKRTIPFGVEPGAEVSDVLRIVDTLAPHGPQTLKFVGAHETDVSKGAPELVPLLTHFKRSFRSVTVFIEPSAQPADGDLVLTKSTTMADLLSTALEANRRGLTPTLRR